jgi:hypothetical protein
MFDDASVDRVYAPCQQDAAYDLIGIKRWQLFAERKELVCGF